MEAVKLSGLIVIKDSIGCSGERLWISYVERCRRKYNNSRLLLTYEWPDTLERRYECVCREGISLEPLNNIQYLLNILNKLNNNNDNYAKIAFFIDSFNMALLWSSSCDQLLRLLKNLSEYGIVVIRIHDENLSDHIWQRIMAVANTVHSLRLPNSSNHRSLVCETISYKKNGRQIKNIELFEVNEEYKLCCSPYKDIGLESTINNININNNSDNNNSNNNNNENSFDEMLLPFDIGLQLSDDELRAKRNLKLPFMAAQTQQGLVGISASGKHKVRAGGRIIYTPDEADDLDDSDPDDDLQI